MNVIDSNDKYGFELILSKKKRYMFRTSNAMERDEWVEVLKKYAELSTSSSKGSELSSPGLKDKEKNQEPTD